MSRSLDALDPQIRRFIEDVCNEGARLRAGRTLDWPQRRVIAAQARAPWREGGPRMRDSVDVPLDSAYGPFQLRVLTPQQRPAAPSPALVYLHGGGWCMFGLDTHDRLLREYADRAQLPVVAIDYSLAPEHPYPAALDQAVIALQWLRSEGARFGIDGQRLALGGDSAGANLAVASALRLRDAGDLDCIQALVLNYGAWTPQLSEQARQQLGQPQDMLSGAEMDEFWDAYLGADAQAVAGPLSAPLHAALHGLPPALLLWGDRDVLAEQNQAMVQRLRDAGVTVDSQVYRGAPHSFIEAMAVSALANDAIGRGAEWVRQHLLPPATQGNPA
ncbi:alpha/beta hydrolase [Stenotrophomonas sp. ZAC14A_NAIMI4_1]|uniref:alpha/beta hydrolase n=1 Tax=Stenotrophomonas sp. ZAC14A_NAIMI4_1 TaxID=2072412 RepID=UPI000D53CC5E|nr:alpha/beta hydrolase [Stenotrophomonas sp. ZAC14A_NAIMI4_1]AWH46716.1 alpha/beta hydrolase [Stenotrophomonas sp. ZAC14A_NAIMI4_1]